MRYSRVYIFFALSLILITSDTLGESYPFIRERDADASADEILTVNADEDWGVMECRNGFLHGLDTGDSLSDSLVALLKPESWRGYKIETYAEAVAHGATITFGTSDHYAWFKGGWEHAKPWLDWDEYEAYIFYEIQVIDTYFPDHQPDFYDIWNEPDHPYFWHGTYEQLVETFARTIDVIKTYKPEAKIVGPSISWYRPDGYGEENIIDLLIDLDTIYGIRLDAIAWHENGGIPDYGPGRPEDIYLDEASIRDAVEEYFPPEYTPEYHVNEYTGGRVHLSPGWTMAYLFWIDYVRIDGASRSCWWIFDPNYEYYCDCWAGLDGLFMQDGFTPQPIYWVHHAYAEMEGQIQLGMNTTSINTLVMATRNDSVETLRLLAGRYYDSTSTSVAVEILGYPYDYDKTEISVARVSSFAQFHYDPPVGMAWPQGPVHECDTIIAVIDGDIDFMLDDFPAGDVLIIDIKPYVLCGDADNSGIVNISDAVLLIAYIFGDGAATDPLLTGDTDCNDIVNISDAVYLIAYIFGGGPAPCAACPEGLPVSP